MYKVFFKDSLFLLTDDRKILQQAGLPLIHKEFCKTKTFIESCLESNHPFNAVLYHDDLEDLFSIFKSCFLYVKAGGGVVRQDDRVLLIKRQGMYDIPKGHLETGETMEQCAIREVEEETGARQVRITAPLTPTYHIYYRDENWYLKKTYWYAMTCPPDQALHPQTEECIEAVFWQPLSELDAILANTHPSLREVFIDQRPASF